MKQSKKEHRLKVAEYKKSDKKSHWTLRILKEMKQSKMAKKFLGEL